MYRAYFFPKLAILQSILLVLTVVASLLSHPGFSMPKAHQQPPRKHSLQGHCTMAEQEFALRDNGHLPQSQAITVVQEVLCQGKMTAPERPASVAAAAAERRQKRCEGRGRKCSGQRGCNVCEVHRVGVGEHCALPVQHIYWPAAV